MGDGQMFPVSIRSGQKRGGGETISYKRRLNARKAFAQTDPCRACYIGPSVRQSVYLPVWEIVLLLTTATVTDNMDQKYEYFCQGLHFPLRKKNPFA